MFRVYADFKDPASFILQQRLMLAGLSFEWCAVESQPRMPVNGRPVSPEERRAAAAALADLLPGEIAPISRPRTVNTRAATAAFAESVADGQEQRMRVALLGAIHLLGRDLSDAEQVRRIVAQVMLPELTLPAVSLRSRNWLSLGAHSPDRLVRLLGGTVTRTGGPLTSTGQVTVDSWRRGWVALGCPPLPTLADTTGIVTAGSAVLASALPGTQTRSAEVPVPRRRPSAAAPLALVGAGS